MTTRSQEFNATHGQHPGADNHGKGEVRDACGTEIQEDLPFGKLDRITDPFHFEGRALRMVIRDAEPWFVARDVCDAIGLFNVGMALQKIQPPEKGVSRIDTPRGAQQLAILSEAGFYRLVMRSDKPAAERFQTWVTSEVLPSIRRTGRYASPGAPRPIRQAPRPSAAREREERLRAKEDRLKLAADRAAERADRLDARERAKLLLEVAREQRENGNKVGAARALDAIVAIVVPSPSTSGAPNVSAILRGDS